MAINRVRVTWAGDPTAGGGLSTFYFDSAAGTAAQQVSAVNTFLTATNDQRAPTCGYTIENDVDTLNAATGALENTTATAGGNGVGTATGDPLPPICQGLLRLFTSGIVNGRLLRGRIFLPGATESLTQSTGGTATTYRADYDAAAAALIADANTTWVVWSKTHGFTAAVGSASTWTKFASLRSRRD